MGPLPGGTTAAHHKLLRRLCVSVVCVYAFFGRGPGEVGGHHRERFEHRVGGVF